MTQPTHRTLKIGRRDTKHESDVTDLQQTLGVNDTGYFGKETKKAVMDFQRNHNLALLNSYYEKKLSGAMHVQYPNLIKEDGIVGKETWPILDRTPDIATAFPTGAENVGHGLTVAVTRNRVKSVA